MPCRRAQSSSTARGTTPGRGRTLIGPRKSSDGVHIQESPDAVHILDPELEAARAYRHRPLLRNDFGGANPHL